MNMMIISSSLRPSYKHIDVKRDILHDDEDMIHLVNQKDIPYMVYIFFLSIP